MAKTVEQLLAEFKIEGLDDKFVSALRSEMSEAHNALQQATALKAEAEQARAAAQAERERIDKAILEMGDGSLNASRLKAQNKALRAVVDSLKEDGLSIDLPEDLFKEEPQVKTDNEAKIPKQFADQLALMGQAIAAADIAARYVGIYGKPFPEDMQSFIIRAQKQGKTVQQLAESEYKLSEELKKRDAEAEKSRIARMKKEWEEEYKKSHPEIKENPFMRTGADSPFTQVSKFRPDEKSQGRNTAGMSDMEKLRKAQERGRQMLAEALQEK